MNILIIEDSLEFTEVLSASLHNCSNDQLKNGICYKYHHNLQEIDYSIDYSIAFIDIDLGGYNGIDIVKKLKSINHRIVITYVTNHSNLVFKSYITQPFYFIRKQYFKDDFSIFLYLFNTIMPRDYLIVTNNRNQQLVYIDDILYIEANHHKCLIYTYDNCFVYHKQLSTLLTDTRLPNFIRIHRSYAVNINKIVSVKNRVLLLYDNTNLTIGRRYYNSFHQQL